MQPPRHFLKVCLGSTLNREGIRRIALDLDREPLDAQAHRKAERFPQRQTAREPPAAAEQANCEKCLAPAVAEVIIQCDADVGEIFLLGWAAWGGMGRRWRRGGRRHGWWRHGRWRQSLATRCVQGAVERAGCNINKSGRSLLRSRQRIRRSIGTQLKKLLLEQCSERQRREVTGRVWAQQVDFGGRFRSVDHPFGRWRHIDAPARRV